MKLVLDFNTSKSGALSFSKLLFSFSYPILVLSILLWICIIFDPRAGAITLNILWSCKYRSLLLFYSFEWFFTKITLLVIILLCFFYALPLFRSLHLCCKTSTCVFRIQNMIKNIKYWGIHIILHSNCILSFIIILRRGLCRM